MNKFYYIYLVFTVLITFQAANSQFFDNYASEFWSKSEQDQLLTQFQKQHQEIGRQVHIQYEELENQENIEEYIDQRLQSILGSEILSQNKQFISVQGNKEVEKYNNLLQNWESEKKLMMNLINQTQTYLQNLNVIKQNSRQLCQQEQLVVDYQRKQAGCLKDLFEYRNKLITIALEIQSLLIKLIVFYDSIDVDIQQDFYNFKHFFVDDKKIYDEYLKVLDKLNHEQNQAVAQNKTITDQKARIEFYDQQLKDLEQRLNDLIVQQKQLKTERQILELEIHRLLINYQTDFYDQFLNKLSDPSRFATLIKKFHEKLLNVLKNLNEIIQKSDSGKYDQYKYNQILNQKNRIIQDCLNSEEAVSVKWSSKQEFQNFSNALNKIVETFQDEYNTQIDKINKNSRKTKQNFKSQEIINILIQKFQASRQELQNQKDKKELELKQQLVTIEELINLFNKSQIDTNDLIWLNKFSKDFDEPQQLRDKLKDHKTNLQKEARLELQNEDLKREQQNILNQYKKQIKDFHDNINKFLGKIIQCCSEVSDIQQILQEIKGNTHLVNEKFTILDQYRDKIQQSFQQLDIKPSTFYTKKLTMFKKCYQMNDEKEDTN